MASPGPPLEEHLAANTLWPEVHKLYGHGNNLYALAAHPSGRLLASACQVTLDPDSELPSVLSLFSVLSRMVAHN